jgi:WD40 repeat protein
VNHPLLQDCYSNSSVIRISKQGTSNYIPAHRNSVADIPINLNINLISSTTTIPSVILSSGSHIYTAAANLDPYPAQISSFDIIPQDNNLIATTTSDCKIKFYDIRMNSIRECYEWRIFSPNYQFLKNSYPTLTSISTSHTLDKLISIGLSIGTVCLMERRSGLVVDSFQAHEMELNKIKPYESCTGHIFRCSGAMDAKSDLLRMWNIQASGSAKCERVFKFHPAYWQQFPQYYHSFQPQAIVKSFDVHSKIENDYVFAITNYSVLQYRSSSLISSPFDSDYTENKVTQLQYTSCAIKRRNHSTTQNIPNMYMNIVYNPQQQPAIDFSTITSAQTMNNANNTTPVSASTPSTYMRFADVKYFPLHKLLLVTTSGGKVQVFT